MKTKLLTTLMLLFALALAACGPAATPAPAPTEAPAEPTEAPAEPTAEPEEEMAPSIAEIAAGDENFSTLVTALDAAGLVETLAGEGEFTVFAPTNDAFAALPEGTVEGLLEDPEGALTSVLLYHVVEGTVTSDVVVTLDSATTLQGEDVTIAVTDEGVMLNDSVMVVTTDIEASNGVIHVIDAVLLPPSMASAEEEMAP
ncbi:MAG: fasciclin domain-containing protein, partial [Anaerolineales bacterium]|nr:fasciclin domain-containing protein [Anaerolineales bacterium]